MPDIGKDYRVEWSIDIEGAKDPEEAARRAWRHMRARGSIANCFDVYLVDGDGVPTRVDLLEIDEERADAKAAKRRKALEDLAKLDGGTL